MDGILSELESRFKREEFHLLFLAFLVHPVFRQVSIKILDESEKKMATTLTRKTFFQGRDFSLNQYFTTRGINYTKRVPQQQKKGGKDIEKQASKMDEGKIFGGNGRY